MDNESHVKELLDELENPEREQIKIDFEAFLERGLSPETAKGAVGFVENLSSKYETTEREKVKSDLLNLLEYSTPIGQAKESVRKGVEMRQRQPLTNDTGSSNENSNSSSSDYELQSKQNYPENWDTLRKQAYERDSYYCQNCGVGGGPNGDAELHAHHIVPVSVGGNHTLSNLSTLCVTCHGLVHKHLE
jgi:5-methylcytosine-specific restriction endonuclease McrA